MKTAMLRTTSTIALALLVGAAPSALHAQSTNDPVAERAPNRSDAATIESTQTAAPVETPVGDAQAEAPTDAPAGDAQAEAPAGAPSGYAAAPPSESTEASQAGQTAAETAEEQTKPVEGQIVLQSENTVLANDLLGTTVYSTADETVGDINDLIVNLDGTVDGVVIGVGGFLGLGEKEVAVEIGSLGLTTTDTDNLRLVLAASKADLEAAPEFKPAHEQRAERLAEEAAVSVRQEDAIAADSDATADRDAAQTGQPTDESQLVSEQETVEPVEGQIVLQSENTILASDILGTRIFSAAGESVGDIGDLIIDLEGTVDGVVIGVGGFLGLGKKNVAVEMDTITLQMTDVGDVWLVLDATREDLEAADVFKTAAEQRAEKAAEQARSLQQESLAASDPLTPVAPPAPGTVVSDQNRLTTEEEPARPVEGQIVLQSENTILASNLLAANVHSTAGETVGDINDLIVSFDGTVDGVVIGVGGFLGIGEKSVAVEMDSLRLTTTDNDDVRLVLDATKSDLDAAAHFKSAAQQRAEEAQAAAADPTLTQPQ